MKNYHLKDQAHRIYKKARLIGALSAPALCSKCDQPSKRVIGHHEDYSKPLDVDWLCDRCHQLRHHEIRLSGVIPEKKEIQKLPEDWFNVHCLSLMLKGEMDRGGKSPSMIRSYIWRLTGETIPAGRENIEIRSRI